jgi:DNA-binding NarL/FixJ family response regulator
VAGCSSDGDNSVAPRCCSQQRGLSFPEGSRLGEPARHTDIVRTSATESSQKDELLEMEAEHRAPGAGHALGSTAVLADAHPLWLRAVESVLDGLGVTTIGTTSVPSEGIELVGRNRPDILVTDLDFGVDELEGAAFIRRALDVQPDLKVIVLTMHNESSTIAETIAAGAAVYIVKTVTPDDLAAAVRQMFEHSIFYAPTEALQSAFGLAPVAEAPSVSSALVTRHLELAADAHSRLTKREREILDLVAEGLPNAEIGRTLWITEQTVKFHLSNVYRKLGVSNRTQASQWTHRRWEAGGGTRRVI